VDCLDTEERDRRPGRTGRRERTAWNGSAVLVLASSADPAAPRATLPERLSWRLSPWSLLIGQFDLTVTHPSALTQPLAVRAPLLGAARPR